MSRSNMQTRRQGRWRQRYKTQSDVTRISYVLCTSFSFWLDNCYQEREFLRSIREEMLKPLLILTLLKIIST